MWAVLAAIVGFIGGIALATLSARLQRRNWQEQECMRAYAEMFAEGEEALRMCSTLIMHLGNLDSQIGNSPFREAAKENPDLQSEYDLFKDMRHEFYASYDAKFHRATKLCLLLERKAGLRAKIEKLEKDYISCKTGLRLRDGRLFDRNKLAMERMSEGMPYPDSLFESLERLRKEVAAEHFHDKDETEKA
jgi:hypothetical protein